MPRERENSGKSLIEVLLVSLYLGLSSFGGPAAHLGYFHAEYVKHRKWVTEELFSDLVALCQFLPGPASRSVQPRLDLCGPRTCGICAGACLLRTIAVLAACPPESCSCCVPDVVFALRLNQPAVNITKCHNISKKMSVLQRVLYTNVS